jgi:hypothetical protein
VKVNGADFNTACKDTVCNADVAESAVKREIVELNGKCKTCPDKQKVDPEDKKKCVD